MNTAYSRLTSFKKETKKVGKIFRLLAMTHKVSASQFVGKPKPLWLNSWL